jgi:hypothetical protein
MKHDDIKKATAVIDAWTANRYFGLIKSYENILGEFQVAEGDLATVVGTTEKIPFPSREEILLAWYDQESYEGTAFVLFQHADKLYEVNGGHCSCHGLEDQWKPEETSWAALKMRTWSRIDRDDAALARYHELLADHA